MAHVRKHSYPPRADGTIRSVWRASWTGPDGKRQSKVFARKREADAHLVEVSAGRIGGTSAMTVADLAAHHIRWFDSLVKSGKRAAVTRDGYQTILDRHVNADAAFARRKLSDLRAPDCQNFLDGLFERTGSSDLAGRARRCLVTWCRFGMRKGWLHTNPAQPCAVEREVSARDGSPSFLLPSHEQLKALIAAAGDGTEPIRDTAIVRLLMFGGLRISELLGLADDAVELRPSAATIRVRERLDRHYRTLDRPKSAKSRRDVPIGTAAALAVRSWRLARGPSRAFTHTNGSYQTHRVPGRLFPDPASGTGVWCYNDFINQCWIPLMRRAGLVEMLPDSKGKKRPVTAFSPHALRHVAVSLWLSQVPQPSAKKVQTMVGHASLQMTMDLYGHLWKDQGQDDAIAAASERLIG
ncbi:tyrosine-type recombinase/integrase [Brevundimonas sp.]|uniref:tyrosine-type recombinase/integrase n=1 Tax=Brevundimonas sp. TaxID=1871086 RepID=UPI00289DE1E8|nr:tyrosine-type recombinase/integrase [Brevundimonas sp.]